MYPTTIFTMAAKLITIQAIANLLARRNKIHHLDKETDETLFKLFDRDPGPSQKTADFNHVTMPSRNWAMITENSTANARPYASAPENFSGEQLTNGAAATPVPEPALSNTTNTKNGHLAVNGSSRPTTAATMPNRLRKAPSSLSNRNRANGNRSRNGSDNPAFKDGHFPLHSGEEGAGTLHRATGENHGMAGDGSLDVVIRVEIDQHDREGKTMGYGLQIPPLNYHPPAAPFSEALVENGHIDDQSSIAPAQNDSHGHVKGINGDSGIGSVSNGTHASSTGTSDGIAAAHKPSTAPQTGDDMDALNRPMAMPSIRRYSTHGTQTETIQEN